VGLVGRLRLFAVGCDARSIVFVRYRGKKFDVEGPHPVSAYTVERFLRAMLQFAIIDGRTAIVTEKQVAEHNDWLGLDVNLQQPGFVFDASDDLDALRRLEALFASKWSTTKQLDTAIPRISHSHLRERLQSFAGSHNATSERELQLLLLGFLEACVEAVSLYTETPVGGTRVDFTIGRRRVAERHAIEIKFQPEAGDLDRMLGQIQRYREQYDSLTLLVARPGWSPQLRQEIDDRMKALGIPLVVVP